MSMFKPVSGNQFKGEQVNIASQIRSHFISLHENVSYSVKYYFPITIM